MLVDQEYQQQRKKQRGAIRAYLSKVAAGLSMAQITRLIRAHGRTGKVEARVYRRQRFAAKYRPADIALLAQVDRSAGPSGPRARAVERAGHATHPEARACRIRQSEIHAPGGDLGGIYTTCGTRGVPGDLRRAPMVSRQNLPGAPRATSALGSGTDRFARRTPALIASKQ
jgi:hypothetical protein